MSLMPRRGLATSTAALLTALATLTALPSAASSTEPTEGDQTAPTVTIRPAELPRGAHPRIPWVFAGTLFDQGVRVGAPRDSWLLGASGGDYLVQRFGTERTRVLRVAPDGTSTRVVSLPARRQLTLSADGATLLSFTQRRADGVWRTLVRLHDPRTGEVEGRRRFGGIVDVLHADAGRVLLGSWTPRPRTLLWDVAQGTTRLLLREMGYVGDLRADRFGTFTDDPYLGGCTTLRRLSSPGEVLSQSCEERVAAISPSGRRVAAIHILSDGLGPREVIVRRDTGRKLAGYRVAEWFGRVDFESDRAILLEASGRTRQAVVRCEDTSCRRATRTRSTPTY